MVHDKIKPAPLPVPVLTKATDRLFYDGLFALAENEVPVFPVLLLVARTTFVAFSRWRS